MNSLNNNLNVLHIKDNIFLVYTLNDIETYLFLQLYNQLKMNLNQRKRDIKPLKRLDELSVIVEIKPI